MDMPRPKSDRPSRTARVGWSIFGFLAGAFAGLCFGWQYNSLLCGIAAAIILGTVLAADGLRVGGGILGSIVQAFFYL